MSNELNACDKLEIAENLMTKDQYRKYLDKVAKAEGKEVEEENEEGGENK